ncbi:MAG: RidA family protein [Planctomycetota bacterium]|nr:RidA family protein [Planctomycetota bacterium]
MAEHQIVATEKAPAAIGPYSQAVVAGSLVYTSGQIGLDPVSAEMVSGGVEQQAQQVLKNLAGVLEAAGSRLSRVVKTTVFLRSMEDFAAVNVVYEQAFGSVLPARSTVAVAGLPKDALVEIEAVASVS